MYSFPITRHFWPLFWWSQNAFQRCAHLKCQNTFRHKLHNIAKFFKSRKVHPSTWHSSSFMQISKSCKNTTWSNSSSQLSHIQFFPGFLIYLSTLVGFTQSYYKVFIWQVFVPFANWYILRNALNGPQLPNIRILRA